MNTQQIRGFILAGNALFTLKSLKTGEHFTYKVVRTGRWVGERWVAAEPRSWQVQVLVGRDNSKDYRRIGIIRGDDDEDFVRIGGIGSSRALSTRGFDWFWTKLRLGNGEKLAQAHFAHAGRCGRCGRTLTHPDSIESGIGPECADKLAFEAQGGVEGLMSQLFGG